MAVWQIESGACTGRGFNSIDVNGICAKFYAYITAIPAAGGPGWTILIDKSGTPTIQNFATGAVDVAGNEITLAGHGYFTGETIIFSTDGVMPGNLNAGQIYWVIKTGANTFKVSGSLSNAYAGSPIDITTQGTVGHHIIIDGPYVLVSNVAAPAINEVCHVVKVGYKTAEAGYIRVSMFVGYDDANKIPVGLWDGRRLGSVDAGAFVYDFRGGDQGMIIQTLTTQWYTSGVDTWTGSANFVEGTGVSTDLTGIAAAGALVNIEVTDSSSFSVNKYYYIWDMSAVPMVNYVKCTATPDGTHITVDVLTNTFPVGSIIAAYSHRHVAFGTSPLTGSDEGLNAYFSKMPYCSAAAGFVFNDQNGTIYGACAPSVETSAIAANAPNDESFYAVQRGFVTEYFRENGFNTSTGMNRSYGITNNVYFTQDTSLSKAIHGRTIGGKNYLYFQKGSEAFQNGSSAQATLFLDTESLV